MIYSLPAYLQYTTFNSATTANQGLSYKHTTVLSSFKHLLRFHICFKF